MFLFIFISLPQIAKDTKELRMRREASHPHHFLLLEETAAIPGTPDFPCL